MKARAPGFTLVELLVVMVLGAIALAAVYQTMISQERHVRQQQAIIALQQNARIASDVIDTDLREVSATGGDIISATDTSVTFRALRKAGIACAVGAATLDVAETGASFAEGDSIFYFMDGADQDASTDDGWGKAVVTATGTSGCGASAFGSSLQQLTLSPTITPNTTWPGAVVRSFVVTTYALRQQGSDWMLFRQEGGNAAVALVGPLASYDQQGLRLRYYDAGGTLIPTGDLAANLQNIRSVETKVTAVAIGGISGSQREQVDSLVTRVYLRGNS